MTRRPVLLLALPILVAGVVAAAGCGLGSAASGDDPASAVPSGAAFYVEATVHPEGQLRDDALAAAGKVLRTPDPAKRIRELVQQALASGGSPKLDYARDIEPWLGEKVAAWFTGANDREDHARGIVLVAAEDTDRARRSIEGALERAGKRLSPRTYKDVDYTVDADGDAFAIVGEFAAFGTEPELRRTIDAADGDSLADEDRYQDAIDDLPDERLGHFYLDVGPLVNAAFRSDPEARGQFEQLRGFFPFDEIGPIAGAFSANGDRLVLDVLLSARGGEAARRFGLLGGSDGSTRLMAELPADAWGALGSANVGPSLERLYRKLVGAFGGAALSTQLRRETGLDLEQDVFSWIGDVAAFVRGETKDGVEGGVVIGVTDEARAAAAFGKLVGALRSRGGVDAQPIRVEGAETAFRVAEPGQPKPVVIARGNGRVVVAYGERAASDGLKADERLGDAETFKQAKDLLGDGIEPAFLLSMPSVVALVGSLANGDEELEEARPYLEAFGVLAAGGEADGNSTHARLVAALK